MDSSIASRTSYCQNSPFVDKPFLFPLPVIARQIVEQCDEKIFVAGDKITLPQRIVQPTAVFVQLLAAVFVAQPVTDVIVKIILIVQPAAFGDLMAERAADRAFGA